MEPIFSRDTLIPASLCDSTGRLSRQGAFSAFMDIATDHAEQLGIGFSKLSPRHLFWLTVKTKIRFYDRPAMCESVRLVTWPEKPGPVRCNRSYEIRRGEELLVAGRTEWAVINTATGAITPSAEVFPPEMDYTQGAALAEGYARIPDRFEGIEPFAEYRVRSTDIDLGGHMNNAAYPRALLGAFSNRELEEMNIRTIDLVFRAPCFEGELLEFYKKEQDGVLDIRLARGEDTILLARLTE